jgi:hypothetical protein
MAASTRDCTGGEGHRLFVQGVLVFSGLRDQVVVVGREFVRRRRSADPHRTRRWPAIAAPIEGVEGVGQTGEEFEIEEMFGGREIVTVATLLSST